MNVLLVGFGNVGSQLIQLLSENDFGVRLIGVITNTRGSLFHTEGLDYRALSQMGISEPLSLYPLSADFCQDASVMDILNETKVDALVDATPTLLPDAGPALHWCQQVLERKVHLVLANKAPLVADFAGLRKRAETSGALLRYEATVMAGTPVFNLARSGLQAGKITRIRGILNGTCNFILTRMEAGFSFAAALKEAQELGYAETEPSADIDGWDTAVKLIILSSVFFGVLPKLDQVNRQSLRHLTEQDIQEARAQGLRWKYVGTLDRESMSVAPIALPIDDPLAHVSGAQNAMTLACEPLGDVTIQGPGAGGRETAFGILSDLLEIQGAR